MLVASMEWAPAVIMGEWKNGTGAVARGLAAAVPKLTSDFARQGRRGIFILKHRDGIDDFADRAVCRSCFGIAREERFEPRVLLGSRFAIDLTIDQVER